MMAHLRARRGLRSQHQGTALHHHMIANVRAGTMPNIMPLHGPKLHPVTCASQLEPNPHLQLPRARCRQAQGAQEGPNRVPLHGPRLRLVTCANQSEPNRILHRPQVQCRQAQGPLKEPNTTHPHGPKLRSGKRASQSGGNHQPHHVRDHQRLPCYWPLEGPSRKRPIGPRKLWQKIYTTSFNLRTGLIT